MKKLMVALTATLIGVSCAFADSLGNTAPTKVIPITKGGTSYTNTVSYGSLYKNIEQLVIQNNSAVTVTAVTYAVCGSVKAVIDTSVITTGSSSTVNPARVYLAYGTTSNAVPYLAQSVQTIFTLGGTNGVANANGLEMTVLGYGK